VQIEIQIIVQQWRHFLGIEGNVYSLKILHRQHREKSW
jgi:hypothetical protein